MRHRCSETPADFGRSVWDRFGAVEVPNNNERCTAVGRISLKKTVLLSIIYIYELVYKDLAMFI